MPLFKQVYNPTSTDQKDSLKRYCSAFQPSMDWDMLLPFVESAELDYIKPYIGDTFYTNLVTAYEAGTMSTAQDVFVRMLQRSIAWYTLYDSITGLAISMSDMGPTEQVSKEGTALFPRQWVSKKGRLEAFRQANRRLDDALKYLENNAGDYSDWTSDTELQAKTRGLFFNNADELKQYLPTEVSRIVYLSLKAAIQEAERRYILPAIGKPFFDELKAAIQAAPATPLSTDQQTILDYIRHALVKWMQISAIPNMRLQLNEQGLVEPSFDLQENTRPASEAAIRSLWINIQDAGTLFLNELKNYLEQNAATYPTYMASDAYQNETPHTAFMDQEDEDGKDHSIVSFM